LVVVRGDAVDLCDLQQWFNERTGQVRAYRIENQYVLFANRPQAMVKMVDSGGRSIYLRKTLFLEFRASLSAKQRARLPLRGSGQCNSNS
jgi:hypothetical protein